jgi:hypothetical protein
LIIIKFRIELFDFLEFYLFYLCILFLFIVDARAQQLEQFRDDYVQPCPNATNGCTIKINFVATSHQDCKYQQEYCTYGCGVQILSGFREEHYHVCEGIPLGCPCMVMNVMQNKPSPLEKCKVTCKTSAELIQHIEFHCSLNEPLGYELLKGNNNNYTIKFIVPSNYSSQMNFLHQYVVIPFGLRTLLIYFGGSVQTMDFCVMELDREATIERLSNSNIPKVFKLNKQRLGVPNNFHYRCQYSVLVDSPVASYEMKKINILGMDAYGKNANTITPISLSEGLSIPFRMYDKIVNAQQNNKTKYRNQDPKVQMITYTLTLK